jgi:hypothetical protein
MTLNNYLQASGIEYRHVIYEIDDYYCYLIFSFDQREYYKKFELRIVYIKKNDYL